MPWLIITGIAGIGAFIGSQVDDLLDKTPQESTKGLDLTKIALYAGIGIALAYGAKKVMKM